MNTSILNPVALQKMGIPVTFPNVAPTPFTIAFYRSRCHEFKGGWTPEPGSKAAGMDIAQKGKYHWIGSECHNVKGRWSFMYTDRTLDGQQFDALPDSERCKTCNALFHEA